MYKLAYESYYLINIDLYAVMWIISLHMWMNTKTYASYQQTNLQLFETWLVSF